MSARLSSRRWPRQAAWPPAPSLPLAIAAATATATATATAHTITPTTAVPTGSALASTGGDGTSTPIARTGAAVLATGTTALVALRRRAGRHASYLSTPRTSGSQHEAHAGPPATCLAASGLHDTGEAFAQSRGALELAWLIAAGAAGAALRQAERRADEAERTREETARRRADEERLHIARELHDSLTHQISVIKVQAEVAVHVARKRGEPVPEALLAIREAGRPRPGSCARPWRRCATTTRPRRTGSTTSRSWWSGPAGPAWTRR